MWPMLLASVLFLGTHLGISSTALRDRLVAALGERGYLIVYSLVAFATLGYLIWMYGALPRYDYFWLPSPELYMVPKLVMPVASILLLGGFIGRERFVEQLRRPLAHEPPDPAVDPGDHVIQVDGLVARSPEVRDAGGFDRGSAALGVEIPELFCESGAVHHSPSGSLPIAAMRR